MSWSNFRVQQTPEIETKFPKYSTYSTTTWSSSLVYKFGCWSSKASVLTCPQRISQIGAGTNDNGKIPHLWGTLHKNSLHRSNHQPNVKGGRRRNFELASCWTSKLRLKTVHKLKIEGNSEKGINMEFVQVKLNKIPLVNQGKMGSISVKLALVCVRAP